MQNNSWFTWMIILGFGWSVAGGAAMMLVTQFGFPYTWMSPLTLVMIGAVAFLVYRGYPIHAWLLAGCVGFILVSALVFARALTVSEPNIPDTYRREFAASDSGSSFMGLYYEDYGGVTDYYIEYEADRDTYLVQSGYETRTPITVQFPPLETVGGQWAFESGSMRLRGGVNASLEAAPENNWLSIDEVSFEPGETLRTAHPEMTVAAPLPLRRTRTPITASAVMTVNVLQEDGRVAEKQLTREFTLEIIGDDYYYYYSQYSDWQRSRRILETPLWAFLLVGSAGAGAAGITLIRRGELQPQPTSGLRMVIRRLSGSQQLGAALYHPQKLPNATDAEQGVYVGRVVAQSPAGRAGLRTGDILIEFAGKPVNNPGAVNRMAKDRKKGDRVPIMVLRNGERIELEVRF